MHSEIFELLKKTLTARRITYADLAMRIGVSEPTIKRIFMDRDCKLSRLTLICDALDLTIDDVIAEANRIEVRPVTLDPKTEAQLAEDPSAFYLYLFLLDGMTAKAMQAHFDLSDPALFLLGRRLEVIGLIEMMPGGRMRLLDPSPVRFRRDGPLNEKLLKLNMDFLREVFLNSDTESSAFLTQTRRISDNTARYILSSLQDLARELSDLARKDQLTHADEDLTSYKLSFAWSAVSYSKLLSLLQDS